MLIEPVTLEIKLIEGSWNLNGPDNFWSCSRKKFTSYLLFPDSISTCQKSSWFINLFLKYSWFKNLAIWLAKSIFNTNQLKMFEAFFTLTWSTLVYKKSCWSTQLLLRYRWFKNPWIWLIEHISDHVSVKIYKLFYCFLNL